MQSGNQFKTKVTEDENSIVLSHTKTYTLNTQRHFKIWFSNNRDIALGIENELRLLRIRKTNPLIELSLIYSSNCLSEVACEYLKAFCFKQRIQLVDFDQVIPTILSDAQDKKIYQIAKQEIENTIFHCGGNLASASDAVRILVPVLKQYGIYTDLDIEFDCLNLPDTLEINRPIILPITETNIENKSIVDLSNNWIACTISDDGFDFVRRLQSILINNYSINPVKLLNFSTPENSFSDQVSECITQKYFTSNPHSNIFGFRAFLQSLNFLDLYHALNSDLKRGVFGLDQDGLTNEQLEEQLNKAISHFIPAKTAKDQLRTIKHNMQLNAVIYFSGPSIYLSALNQLFHQQCGITNYSEYLMQYSANHNHFNLIMKEAKHASVLGVSKELSWTTLGEYNKQQRELQLIKSATCIQRFFRRPSIKRDQESNNFLRSNTL